jgi:sec-independent protein translocase protein TatB
MFGIGAQELAIILVVALLVFGPKRLPELARTLGRGLAEFRRASSDLRQTINFELEADEKDPRSGPKSTARAAEHAPGVPPGVPGDEPADQPDGSEPDGSQSDSSQPQSSQPDSSQPDSSRRELVKSDEAAESEATAKPEKAAEEGTWDEERSAAKREKEPASG